VCLCVSFCFLKNHTDQRWSSLTPWHLVVGKNFSPTFSIIARHINTLIHTLACRDLPPGRQRYLRDMKYYTGKHATKCITKCHKVLQGFVLFVFFDAACPCRLKLNSIQKWSAPQEFEHQISTVMSLHYI